MRIAGAGVWIVCIEMKAKALRMMVAFAACHRNCFFRPDSRVVGYRSLFASSWADKDDERSVDRRHDQGWIGARLDIEAASASLLRIVATASRGRKTGMKTSTPTLCVYNQTRECFLGLRVTRGGYFLRAPQGLDWQIPSTVRRRNLDCSFKRCSHPGCSLPPGLDLSERITGSH